MMSRPPPAKRPGTDSQGRAPLPRSREVSCNHASKGCFALALVRTASQILASPVPNGLSAALPFQLKERRQRSSGAQYSLLHVPKHPKPCALGQNCRSTMQGELEGIGRARVSQAANFTIFSHTLLRPRATKSLAFTESQPHLNLETRVLQRLEHGTCRANDKCPLRDAGFASVTASGLPRCCSDQCSFGFCVEHEALLAQARLAGACATEERLQQELRRNAEFTRLAPHCIFQVSNTPPAQLVADLGSALADCANNRTFARWAQQSDGPSNEA
mmetsp:Transcript_56772/g.183889  ORF Transcript_56772/g.183889 Transcript_56772/m.183889 type:complete len:274 (-) Transcript_56772:1470-2291(-)